MRLFPTQFLWKFSFHLLSICTLLSVGFGLVRSVSADTPAPIANTAASTSAVEREIPVYKTIEPSTGVWNDGKAALWDLAIIDQYKWFGPQSRGQGYKPAQPIKFSHVTHVQKNKMECQACHWNVAKSSYASLPEVQYCMGCHGNVKGTSDEQKAEIAKIADYWQKGIPIPWIKVHVFPAHANFNHKRHVKAGLNCQECHGQIPKMETVERVSGFKMGWCLDCHRNKGASIDCWTCHK